MMNEDQAKTVSFVQNHIAENEAQMRLGPKTIPKSPQERP